MARAETSMSHDAGAATSARAGRTHARPEDDLDRFWNALPRLIGQDSGSAVDDLLAKGQCAYYGEDETPDGLLVRERPGGVRQLVRIESTGEDIVIRDL